MSDPAPAIVGPPRPPKPRPATPDLLEVHARLDQARATLESLRQPIRPDADEQPTTLSGAQHLATPVSPGKPRFGAWFNRPRRVLLTLMAVWVVAVFDLGYTLAEFGTADFFEMNPLAAKLLGGSPHAVMAFKFGLLGFGTLILLGLRRHAIAELACWFLFVSKLYVAVRWYGYFDCVLHDYVNPLLSPSG